MMIEHLTSKSFEFKTPNLIYGMDSIQKLETEAKKFGNKIFLVTDENIRKTEPFEIVEEGLGGLDVEIYDEIRREPTVNDANNIAETARKKDYDMVIGIGGGSVIDMAKISSIMQTNGGRVEKYLEGKRLENKGIPSIYIPTTAGTGSEVTQAIVLSEPSGIKNAIWDPLVIGDLAIIDPYMTKTCPPKVTAFAGADALSHAFEALFSTGSNKLTDSLASESIRLCYENLEKAVFKKENLEARKNMAYSSLMAGLAFNNAGLIMGHAVAYTYASDYELPHGTSCGLTIPYVISFLAPTCPEKIERIGRALELDGDVEEMEREIASSVKGLLEELGQPVTLKDIGVPENEVSDLAKSLLEDYSRLLTKNPRKINKSAADKLFQRMWEGEI